MNRLKELRKNSGKTQKEVFEETGIPIRSIQNWENGKRQINLESAKQLADYFGVSVGYLHGYSYNKRETKSVEKLESIFVEFLVNINTISDTDLEDLKALSNRLYEMAIAEKTRRYHVDTLSDKVQEEKNKKAGRLVEI